MMHQNLIGGEWVKSTDAGVNISPADISDVIGEYARGSADDVSNAVSAAQQALPGWANASPQVRHDLLEKIGHALMTRSAEIGRVLAREEGKTLAEATGECVRAAQVFKFFAGEAVRLTGDKVASVRPGVDVDIMREPIGVVGLITPWNFPIAIPAWKTAPALAYGNCVVLKPADLTPASAHILAEIIQEAGCPPGVFNLVMGRGSVVGEAMAAHPGIAGISFTGSVPVGRALAVKCAESMKKIQLEMGGKNPMIVMDDADLDISVPVCIDGAFYCTGQRCTSSSRFIVHENIHDRFVEAMTEAMNGLIVGNPLDANTKIGPVVDSKQLASNIAYVDLAREEGAEVMGGERLNRETEGYYQAPALFTGTSNDMRINREEIFGPISSVIKVKDFDEALSVANDTDFGLSSGICTGSLEYANRFKKQSQAGMVMINQPTAGADYHVPFGGRKGSSYGSREQGRYAVEFYTSVKTAYICDGA